MLLGWSDAATTGIFVLVAAALGMVGGLLVQLALERRRETADVRQARRLIAGELQRVWFHHEGLVETGRYPATLGSEAARFMPDELWQQYRPVLARHLSDEVYDDIAIVLDTIATTRDVIATGTPNDPVPDEIRRTLANGLELVGHAYESLTGKTPRGTPVVQSTEGGMQSQGDA